jgi:hypothetical protein
MKQSKSSEEQITTALRQAESARPAIRGHGCATLSALSPLFAWRNAAAECFDRLTFSGKTEEIQEQVTAGFSSYSAHFRRHGRAITRRAAVSSSAKATIVL